MHVPTHRPTSFPRFAWRVLLAPALLLAVTAGVGSVSAGPTDNLVPAITTVQMQVAEIGPGDHVAVVVNGTFAPASLGTQPVVTIAGDPTATFAILAWDENQIFGTLSTTTATPLGQKSVRVQQQVGGQAGEATKPNALRVGFTPVVTSISPTGMVAEDGAAVVVSGQKFEANATVSLSHSSGTLSPAATVNAAGTTLSFSLASNPELGLGTWTVTVTNPGAGRTATTPFSVTGASPPSVSEVISAGQVGQGVSNVPVTVNGANFYKGVAVSFSGAGLTASSLTRVNRTQLTFNAAAAAAAAPGHRDLLVTNGDGAQVTVADAVEIVVKPEVTDGQVFNLPQGVRRSVVVVQGTGFRDDTVASFLDGSGVPTTDLWVQNARLVTGGIRLEVNASESAPLDQRLAVRLLNPGGGSDHCEVRTGQRGCIDMTPGPVATAVEPDSLVPGDAATLVIRGSRFLVAGQSGAAFPFVMFGGTGIRVVGPTAYTPTSLTVPVEVDAGAALGARDVTVVNPDGGRGTCQGCLTLTPA